MSSQRIITMTVQICLLFLLMNLTPIQCDTATMLSSWTSGVSSSITSNQPSGTSGPSLASTYVTSPTTQFTSMYSSSYITSPTTQFTSMYSSSYITSPTTPVSSPYITSPTTPVSSPYITSPTTPVSSPYITSPTTPISSPYVTSPTSQLSSLSTMNPSTYMTSSNVQSSYTAVTTQHNNVTYDLIFQFTVSSSVPLMTGNFTNATILNSVQAMVRSAFSNLTNFIITVIRVEIRIQAKSTTYSMLTESLFQTSGTSCLATCIQNAASMPSSSTQTFQLLASGNTLTNASTQSVPILVNETSLTTTTTTIATNYPTGESPPGRAAQLGMGLGISFMAVIIIAEVIILYRRYGIPTPNRQSQYEMSSQLS